MPKRTRALLVLVELTLGEKACGGRLLANPAVLKKREDCLRCLSHTWNKAPREQGKDELRCLQHPPFEANTFNTRKAYLSNRRSLAWLGARKLATCTPWTCQTGLGSVEVHSAHKHGRWGAGGGGGKGGGWGREGATTSNPKS